MKIKIFNLIEAGALKKEVNDFVQGKNIKDIQYRPDKNCNNVMVVYE